MPDTAQEEQSIANGPSKIPPKRKAPKLRRQDLPRQVPNPEPQRVNEEAEQEPPARQSDYHTEEDTVSIDEKSVATQPESLPGKPPTEDVRPLQYQEKRRPRGKRTIELTREKDQRPEIWENHKNTENDSQQLLPLGDLGDIGNTVNEAGDLVRNVGAKAVDTVDNTAGKTIGSAVGSLQQEKEEKEEQLRLRLDLNLDMEVHLKAKIHGDLTLQLL